MNVSVHFILKMYGEGSHVKKLVNKQHQYYIVHNSIKPKPIPKEIPNFVSLHGIMNALMISNKTLCQCCCYLTVHVRFGKQLLS